MVIATVSVVPVGTKTPSLSGYVAKALRAVTQAEGVNYQLMSMGTILERELDVVLAAVSKMHETLFDPEVQRVLTTVTIDDRRDKKPTMAYKVESVMRKQSNEPDERTGSVGS